MSAPVPVQQIGLHRVEGEGPDLLILRASGDVSAEEARRLILIDRELAQKNGYSLILIDARGGSRFGAGARQAMFAAMQQHPGYIGSTAIFGLNGPLVLLMKLVLRAVSLLGTSFDDEMQIFSTEAEGRAFLAQRRPLRQKQTQRKHH